MSLKDLYHPQIIEWDRNPTGFEKIENPKIEIQAFNMICGDKFRLYPNDTVNQDLTIKFFGYGCALSKASTSLLVSNVSGKNQNEAIVLIEDFLAFVNGESSDEQDIPESWKIFRPVKNHPSRIKCVTLSWESLLSHLKFQEKK